MPEAGRFMTPAALARLARAGLPHVAMAVPTFPPLPPWAAVRGECSAEAVRSATSKRRCGESLSGLPPYGDDQAREAQNGQNGMSVCSGPNRGASATLPARHTLQPDFRNSAGRNTSRRISLRKCGQCHATASAFFIFARYGNKRRTSRVISTIIEIKPAGIPRSVRVLPKPAPGALTIVLPAARACHPVGDPNWRWKLKPKKSSLCDASRPRLSATSPGFTRYETALQLISPAPRRTRKRRVEYLLLSAARSETMESMRSRDTCGGRSLIEAPLRDAVMRSERVFMFSFMVES